MAIKHASVDGKPKVSKNLQGSKWNKDHVQEDVDHTIDSNYDGGDGGGLGEEMGDYSIWVSTNLKENLGAILLNALENLKCCDAGLKFQCKKLEFMDFMNQERKCGKEKRSRQYKFIKVLMIQGVWPFSSIK